MRPPAASADVQLHTVGGVMADIRGVGWNSASFFGSVRKMSSPIACGADDERDFRPPNVTSGALGGRRSITGHRACFAGAASTGTYGATASLATQAVRAGFDVIAPIDGHYRNDRITGGPAGSGSRRFLAPVLCG